MPDPIVIALAVGLLIGWLAGRWSAQRHRPDQLQPTTIDRIRDLRDRERTHV